MNSIHQTTDLVEEKGWISSCSMPVTREDFKTHQAEKRSETFSIKRAIQAIAMGILAATQSMRFPMGSSATRAQVALPALGLHVWSQIPMISAQAIPPPGPQGDEFQVNTYTIDSQSGPSVAAFLGGGFVVTWSSDGQDGSSYGVYGQRFDKAGAKVGSEFPINTYRAGEQSVPSVVVLKGGGFVVTWRSDGQDGSQWGVYGQVFDGTGAKVGNEFRVNTYTTLYQSIPSVAALTGGGFVVTWYSGGQDGSGSGSHGQRFDRAGAKIGREFQVNTYTRGHQSYPSVAALAGGGFVVTWRSEGQDGSAYGVYGQRFNSAGVKVGSEFRINTYTTNSQWNPSVATLAEGGFVVTWQSSGQDGSEWGIYGQLFDEMGTKVGIEFRVNTYTTLTQSHQSVAPLTGGGFVVTWKSMGQDGSEFGVYGQRFNKAGVKAGSEFEVNTYTAGKQEGTSVAGLIGGGFVVTWGSEEQDGSGKGIYGRLFPGNAISTIQPTTTLKSSTGLAMRSSQTKRSEIDQTLKIPKGSPKSSDVTEPEISNTSPSTNPLGVLASETGTDPTLSSDQATSQTSVIVGVAMGVTALACSLLSGGLFFWRKKRADDEGDPAVQLETGNFPPNVDADQTDSSGGYQLSPEGQSHYKDWPKEAPVNDGSHYHQNIEVLNQNMAQRYGDESSPLRQSENEAIQY